MIALSFRINAQINFIIITSSLVKRISKCKKKGFRVALKSVETRKA